VWSFVVRPPATERDMQDIVDAFEKVLEAVPVLRETEGGASARTAGR
jgi:hypothetical protein